MTEHCARRLKIFRMLLEIRRCPEMPELMRRHVNANMPHHGVRDLLTEAGLAFANAPLRDEERAIHVSAKARQAGMAGGEHRRGAMAGAFSKLASDQDPPGVVPGFLRPIDTKAIAKELKLSENGAERGKQELPRSDERIWDAVEQTIIQKIEAEWTWQGDALIKTLRAYADRLIGFSVSSKLAELRLIADDTKARFLNANVQAEAELGALKESYIGARDEFRRFKSNHRLERPARDVKRRGMTIGLLIFLIAVESLLNGLFFKSSSDYGLIGGVGTAVGISAVNIIFAFLVGLVPIRFINYRNKLVQFLAVLATVIATAGLLLLHAFAAHYRDALAAVPEDRALAEAVRTLFSDPFVINSLASGYLFGLGILFAIGSIWKGSRYDDPYPFYGAVWRRADSARIEYSSEHQLLFDDLEEHKEAAISQIQAGITMIPLFPQRCAQIRVQRTAQTDAFRAYENSVETAANQLLQIYRDENRRQRTTIPPAHFSERWKLPHSFLKAGQTIELMADPQTPEPEIPAVLAELQNDITALLSQYSELLLRNPHPTKMD